MNAHGKPQDDIAKSDKQAREMIGMLEAVDRRMTPQHVARRFRELLDDIGDSSPTALAGQAVSLANFPGAPAEPDGVFGDSEVARATDVWSTATGYRRSTTAAVAGVTPRQLDYWARTGLVEPSVRAAEGSRSERLYSFRDVLVLKVVKGLLDTGIALQQIRGAVRHLYDYETKDLTQLTLMSDGVSVYERTSPDEVVDRLAGGKGVFGIDLARVWQEVARELAELLPARQTLDNFVVAGPSGTPSGASKDDLVEISVRHSG